MGELSRMTMPRALLAAIAAIHCILPVQGSPQLYGFTSSSATAPTQFVRMDASTGSITALWPLADFGPTASLEPRKSDSVPFIHFDFNELLCIRSHALDSHGLLLFLHRY